MKAFVKFSFIIFILFSLFGLLLFGNIIHELSHKQDFKNIVDKDTDNICILQFNKGAVASYSFVPNNYSEFERINKYTEVKAYSITIFIYIIYIFIVISICLFLLKLEKRMGEKI